MKVAAVVVTFRRRALLLECLDGLGRQTRPPDAIVAVDNAGERDLPAVLEARYRGAVTCFSQPENIGSAGGYAAGTEWACRNGFEWAWLMDDDCEPLLDALEELLRALPALPGASALASCHLTPKLQPVGTAAGIHDWRSCRLKLLPADLCAEGIRPVDSISSSGMFVNLACLPQVGVQNTALFTLEDCEFSWRLAQAGPLYHVGSSRMIRKISDSDWLEHRGGRLRAPARSFWRSYYVFRNSVNFYLRTRPGARTAAVLAWRYLHALAGVAALDDRKLFRMKLLTRAFLDGVRGRMGKTFDPEVFSAGRF